MSVQSKNKITARQWYTDIDLNITPHPSSGDLVLKQDKEDRQKVSKKYYVD